MYKLIKNGKILNSFHQISYQFMSIISNWYEFNEILKLQVLFIILLLKI